MEVKGVFKRVYDTKTGDGKNGQWKRVSFIISAKERVFAFDAFNKQADVVEQASSGDIVSVDFKINCREYQGKFFTSLEASSFSIVEKANTNKSTGDDGLPF